MVVTIYLLTCFAAELGSIQTMLFVQSASPQAVSIHVGEVAISVPACDSHRAIRSNTQQFSFMESSTPPSNRLLYLEAPIDQAEAANRGELIDLNNYLVIQSFRPAEHVPLDFDEFTQFADQTSATIKTALEPASMDQIAEMVNRQMKAQQGVDLDFQLGEARLVGEPRIVNESLSFSMVIPMEVSGDHLLIACSVKMLIIKRRLLYFYAYMALDEPVRMAQVEELNANFVKRVRAVN